MRHRLHGAPCAPACGSAIRFAASARTLVRRQSLPPVDTAVDRVLVDLRELLRRKLRGAKRACQFHDLLGPAGPDQRRSDTRIAQNPADGRLGQALPTLLGDCIERAHMCEVCAPRCSGSSDPPPGRWIRASAGMPSRYLLVSRPCANAPKAIHPTPVVACDAASRSCSIQRSSKL